MPSRENVEAMFNLISSTYDRSNRISTFGLDRSWRKQVGVFLPLKPSLSILDCATGTADQIIALLDTYPSIASIIGIDLAENMLSLAAKKLVKKPYAHKVSLQQATALALPFPDQHFDCVTLSFGIRNMIDVMIALKECRRVLKPRGRLLILEATLPRKRWLKILALFYLRYGVPLLGGGMIKRKEAYRYLYETIRTFPQGERFCNKMKTAGFASVQEHLILGGMATIYQGDNPAPQL